MDLQRTRVLFVIGSLGGGGAERQLLEIVTHLDRTRFAPALYLAYRRGELLDEVPGDVPIFAFVDGVTKRTWPQRALAKLRCPSAARALHLFQVLQEQRADLLFAWGLRTAYETVTPARIRGIPRIVYECVDPVAELDLEFSRWTPFRWQKAQWSFASADRVYGNADDLRRRLIDYYVLPASQVETFYNLRDFRRLETLAEAFVPEWPATGTKLLTIGRLSPQKGQHVLLEAMAELQRRGRDVQLTIVGQGPSELALREQSARLGIASRVQFTGYVANTAPYYRHADLFVLPSLFEGLPNVLIEAAALGVPCVASDCPTGPREILENGRWGRLVSVNDVPALTGAIAATMDEIDGGRAMAMLARLAIRSRFDVVTGIRAFEERLLEVIRTARSSA